MQRTPGSTLSSQNLSTIYTDSDSFDRKTAAIATKNLTEATQLIQDLRLEVGALKRKLADLQDREGGKELATIPPPTRDVTDIEVDSMMQLQNLQLSQSLGGIMAARATPFQE